MIDLSNEPRVTNNSMVHWRIAEIAKHMAHVYYDRFAFDNDFYKMFPSEQNYVALEWSRFIPEARDILVDMLTMTKYTDEQKEDIMEALCLDRSLPVAKTKSVIQSLKKAAKLRSHL